MKIIADQNDSTYFVEALSKLRQAVGTMDTSSKITKQEKREASAEKKISFMDERHSIVNELLREIKVIVSEEQKDLRKHRTRGILYIAIFLSIVTIITFVLLFLMVLYEKGSQAIQLALIAAVFSDTLGLVYIVFRYLFADSHKIFDVFKGILELYEKETKDSSKS